MTSINSAHGMSFKSLSDSGASRTGSRNLSAPGTSVLGGAAISQQYTTMSITGVNSEGTSTLGVPLPTSTAAMTPSAHPAVKRDGRLVVIAAAICFIVATVFLVTRLLGRLILRRQNPNANTRFGADDALIILGYLFFVSYCVSFVVTVLILEHGYEVGHVTNEARFPLQKLIFTLQLLFALSFGFTKMSVAMMLIFRIFSHTMLRIYKRWAIGISVVCGLWFVGAFVEPFVLCTSISAYFNLIVTECGNVEEALTVVNALDIATDFALLAEPLVQLYNLKNISRARRIKATIVLSTGFLAVMVAITRFVVIVQTNYADPPESWLLFLMSMIQTTLGICVACIPSSRPFFEGLLAFIKRRCCTKRRPASVSAPAPASGSAPMPAPVPAIAPTVAAAPHRQPRPTAFTTGLGSQPGRTLSINDPLNDSDVIELQKMLRSSAVNMDNSSTVTLGRVGPAAEARETV